MRIVLFVEGHTEKQSIAAFLKRWLDARLPEPVGITTVRFEGWSEFYRDIPSKVRLHLDNPKKRGEIVAAIGLIDLYGPTFYPKDKETVADRHAWAKQDIERKVGNERFHQFFAVHETEAWLMSDTGKFPPEIRPALVKRAAKPETVNFDEPPAKLLDHLYMQHLRRHYGKVTDGRNLFDKLDPAVVYAKCPYFQKMMDELLELLTPPAAPASDC